ncbi:MAG: helix-turn-helix transcriptional regulator [Cellulosilyticum sp.]|nr:helix-turn-helix transcriptional regulator [Cellulosilyticum sp.]
MHDISDTISHLSKLCEIIHTTTGLDIALFDTNHQPLLFLSQMNYPFLTHKVYANYKNEVEKHLGHLNHSASYLHPLPEVALIYYDVRVQVTKDLAFYACIGPVLSEIYSEELVLSLAYKLKIDASFTEHFTLFYRSLPYLGKQISNTFWLSYHLLTTLPDVSSIHMITPDTTSTSKVSATRHLPNTSTFIPRSEIQMNYSNELKWRKALARGDLKAAQKAHALLSSNDFLYRTPNNPLRTIKNILFSLNTLSRAAAIDGGADAIEVHKTHELFSIRIENATTVIETTHISEAILPTYCHLVIASHTKNFSPIVAKAIKHLYAHYDAPLTLQSVAKNIHCSEGHLSRTFQKETGKTLGAYLNELRINQALSMLSLKTESISDIALAVGFSSYNKFSIEFKKHTGKSATQYLEDLQT